MLRRDFLKAAPAAAMIVASTARGGTYSMLSGGASMTDHIQPFQYEGVKLLESRFRQQYQLARDFYYAVPDDDILHGFRASAGLSTPGQTLGGWRAKNSSTVFGQWLSGMARMYRATGDSAIRDKAVQLMMEWGKTIKPDGDCGMRHYPFDKMVCGLVDLQMFGDCPDAIHLLSKITGWASKTFSRENIPARARPDGIYQGRPSEWYTLSENLFRAYKQTGDPVFKAFGEVWLYHAYWDKFRDTAAPSDAHGVHAYSHTNSFSSAAMAYAVTSDPMYLQIIRNAYDYMQNFQCYATGGFGPAETFMSPDGGLGRALEGRYNTFETVCGSWAGFKLSRYLMQFTGEARFGDWIERLLYNGIGAALPITGAGKNFYYSDYRLAGGMKVYNWENYTCCSGTYIQNVVDYHNLIYFKSETALFVNLYVPSEVFWAHSDGEVKLVQETNYPEADTVSIKLEMKRKMKFTLNFRVPGWSSGMSISVNGIPSKDACAKGTWASIEREWTSGDRVQIVIPLSFRMEPVDKQHPHRVAIVRGPVVYVIEADYHEPLFRLPEEDADLVKWLVPDKISGLYRVVLPDGGRVVSKFHPFYEVGEGFPYKMYFDKDQLPVSLW
ncbi:MAG: beta-L-arabinofuranosidase domain-containing protein [Bacteroidota bacterium]|jgi:DUF1680 family protein